jgi:hypothetical protein
MPTGRIHPIQGNNLPLANVFYSLFTIGDFPAWGQQPATYYVIDAPDAALTARPVQMFLSDFEGTLSTVPTMFSNGNHESADAKLPEVAFPPDAESAVPDSGRPGRQAWGGIQTLGHGGTQRGRATTKHPAPLSLSCTGRVQTTLRYVCCVCFSGGPCNHRRRVW